MTLGAHFAVRRSAHNTRIDLDIEAGEVVALVGPNGAGKTTTLRALAGLLPVDDGTISLNGRRLAGGGVHVPAHQRDVGVVFQDHLLFPHLTVLDNVAFGLQARGARRGDAHKRAHEWLERLEVDNLARRRPGQLSGGQAQRVAIARALATDPAMLLLDEPTASLDAAAAMGLRTELRSHLTAFGGVSIVVTHTALDAMLIADRLVVLDDGVIVQDGKPAEVAAQPRTHHVAALVGLNLVSGEASDGVITMPAGGSLVAADRLSGPVFAAFPPSAVALFETRPTGSPRNVWRGRVTSLAPHGDVVRVQVDAVTPLLADVTPEALTSVGIHPGADVWASVKATEVTIYPGAR
ncbi:MAG: ABC transporter ATP-binding protein [Nocardioidaceae bacterium]